MEGINMPLFGLINRSAKFSLRRPYSNEYPIFEKLEPRLLLDAGAGIENEFVKLEVNDSGAFTMQRSADDQWLLFPAASTSAFSIKVDDSEYWTRDTDQFVSVTNPITEGNGTILIEYVTPENVHLVHRFNLAGQSIEFNATVTNLDSTCHRVATRYLFDTQVDQNDGAPLYAPGIIDSRGSSVCTYETDIPDVNFLEWKSYDKWPEPNLVGIGTLFTIPERMVFASWSGAIGNRWQYTPDPDKQFYYPPSGGDSAVLMYFDLDNIAPNHQKQTVTYYGIGQPEGTEGILGVTNELRQLAYHAENTTQHAFRQFASDFADASVALRSLNLETFNQSVGFVSALTAVATGQVNTGSMTAQPALTRLYNISPDAAQLACEIADLFINTSQTAGTNGIRFDAVEFLEQFNNWLNRHNANAVDRDNDGDTDNIDYVLNPQNDADTIAEKLFEAINHEFAFFHQNHTTLPQDGLYGLTSHMNNRIDDYIETLQINQPEDYPEDNVIQYLRNIRNTFVSARTHLAISPLVNDDPGQNPPSTLGSYHSQSTLINEQIEQIGSQQSFDWFFHAAQHPADQQTAGITTHLALPDTNIIGHIIALTNLTQTATTHGHYHIATGEAMQASVNQQILAAGSDANNICELVLGSIEYLNQLQQNDWAALDIDNSNVQVIEDSFYIDHAVINNGQISTSTQGQIRINNPGNNTLITRAFVSIYRGPTTQNVIDNNPVMIATIPPANINNGEHQLDFQTPKMLPNSNFYTTQYDAFCYLQVGPAINPQNFGPFYDSLNLDFQDVIDNLPDTTEIIWQGSLKQGNKWTQHFSPTHATDGIYLTLKYAGSDLDMHLYDRFGNHLGIDYVTGKFQNQISGAKHSGHLATIERIFLPSAARAPFDIEVVGLDTDGELPFVVVASDLTYQQKPVINCSSPSLNRSVQDELKRTTYYIHLHEITANASYPDLNINVSDFVSGTYIINAANFTLDIPSNTVPPGDSITVQANLTIPDDAPAGRYFGSFKIGNNTIEIPAILNIFPGRTKAQSTKNQQINYIEFPEADGTWANIIIEGGYADLFFTGNITNKIQKGNSVIFQGQNLLLNELQLFDTNIQSSVTFEARGADNIVSIGTISAKRPIYALHGDCLDLVAGGIRFTGNGFIESIELNSLSNGADIIMPGVGSAKGISINAKTFSDGSNLILASHLDSLDILQWGTGWLQTTFADTIQVIAETLMPLSGNIAADMTFTGADRRQIALRNLKVEGTIIGSNITAASGEFNNIDVGAWKGGSLNATSVRKLSTNLQNPAADGSFSANLNITGNPNARHSLTNANIEGKLTNANWNIIGNVRKINVRGLTDDFSLTVQSEISKLNFNNVRYADVNVNGLLNSAKAVTWNDGSITANAINRLHITGNRRKNIPGNFGANIIITGPADRYPRGTLASARIDGSLTSCSWNITGDVNRINVGGRTNNFDLRINSEASNITFARVDQADININGHVSNIRAQDFNAGQIHAAQLNRLQISGDRRNNVPGNFGANLFITAAGVQNGRDALRSAAIAATVTGGHWDIDGHTGRLRIGASLQNWLADFEHLSSLRVTGIRTPQANNQPGILSGIINCRSINRLYAESIVDANLSILQTTGNNACSSLRVSDWIEHSEIVSLANISRVRVGAVRDSGFFAGSIVTMIDENDDGIHDLPTVTTPLDFGQFNPNQRACIDRFSVTGIRGETFSFINSTVAAATFQNISITNPQTDNNGQQFGISADYIRRLNINFPQQRGRWNDLIQVSDSLQFDDHCVRLV